MRKNWLWLWILPTALAWLLVTLFRPVGATAFWAELAIIFLCSCFCGFALAFKGFSTLKERLSGAIFFTGGSLCVISSVLFIGCMTPCGRPSAGTGAPRIIGETSNKGWVSGQIAPRDRQADSSMVDLSPYYDCLLLGQFNHFNPPAFQPLKPGTHTWDGIKFDVRGMVMAQPQPDGQITGIPLRQKCIEIAFLEGAYRGIKQHRTYGHLVIHFANGLVDTIPLVFSHDAIVDELSAIPPGFDWVMHNATAWAQKIPVDRKSHPNFVFYIKKWINPHPDEVVTTIDLVPTSGKTDPILVAITVRAVEHDRTP